jgi:ATP-dependent exoDNAse (exonuclease V) alpha subunit
MAIYHLHLKIITRGAGKSAVGAAAYRSGETLTNEYDGELHDYTHKDGVIYTEMLLPDHAPREFAERSVLWNAVETIERYKNAQLAREVEVALPVELTREQNISLLRKYITSTFVAAGMCADICMHDPDRETPNPHAHIMLTMRPFNEDKTWGAKLKTVGKKTVYTTDWNERDKAEEWRKAWADAVNAELAAHGFAETVDHRSYERQGIDKIPSIHLGVSATQMERRGIVTDRGNINREIAVSNSQLRQLRARIKKVSGWLEAEKANTPPTMYDTFMALIDAQKRETISDSIRNVKLMAKTLVFIQNNKIRHLPDLADKVSAMRRDFEITAEKIKNLNRRVETLDKHIRHSENFKTYRKFKTKYDALYAEYKAAQKAGGLFAKSKAQKALDVANSYAEKHRAEIALFTAAEKYLRGVLQERFDPKGQPPLKKWRDERETCKQELGGLRSEYETYKSEIQNAETIKRYAVSLMLPDEPQEQSRRRSRAWEQGR